MGSNSWWTFFVLTTLRWILALPYILNWILCILPYLLQERVKVENVEFEIIKSEEDLCHGTFDSVCVSFLRHEDIEGAQLNNSLLRRQSSAQFVHPQMPINKPNIWLAVEKIDSTLEQFIRNDKGGICSSLCRIFARYEDYL